MTVTLLSLRSVYNACNTYKHTNIYWEKGLINNGLAVKYRNDLPYIKMKGIVETTLSYFICDEIYIFLIYKA